MEQIQVQEKELSLKDILILVKEYLREIRKSWFFAIPLILAVGGYYVYQHHKEGIKYPAGVTFMVNEEEGEDIGAGSGIGALLKSFTGKGGKDNGTGLEKVLQLFKSKSIIERAIFKKVKVDGVDDYVANHLINIYTLEKLFDEYSNDKWLEPIKNLKTYSFKSSNIDSFTNEEKLLLIVIYEAIAGNKLEGIDSMILPTLDDKSNIMNFGVTTNSEDLTIAILEGIYAELSDFYVKQTVQKQTKVYDIVKAKGGTVFTLEYLTGYSTSAIEQRILDKNKSQL